MLPFQTQDVVGAWSHSHEEDSGTQQAFRPASFPFPRARGRFGFRLGADGRATVLGHGPDDRTVQYEAAWTHDGRAIRIDVPGRPLMTFVVDRIEPDCLVVTKS